MGNVITDGAKRDIEIEKRVGGDVFEYLKKRIMKVEHFVGIKEGGLTAIRYQS